MTLTELQQVLESRPDGDAMMSAKDIWELCGCGETHFYTKLAVDPEFPAPIKLGRTTRWWRSEVLAFFERKRVKPTP